MNTRFAAIAGTLLVGLSLFVTSLVTEGLQNSTSRFGNAQTCGVSEGTFDLGGASWNPRGNCYRYYGSNGSPGINATCSDGRRFQPSASRDIIRWVQSNYGGTCFSAERWAQIAQAWCCGVSSTLTPTNSPPGALTSTPLPTQQPTPEAGAGCPRRPVGGQSCVGIEQCCADGHFCQDLGQGTKRCIPLSEITPTPGGPPRCLPTGDRNGTSFGCSNPAFPGGNPCCAPNSCSVRATREIDDPENPGKKKTVYDITCNAATPTLTLTPTPMSGVCGDRCLPGQCAEGSCRNVANPSDPNPDCRTSECKCMVNTDCTDGSKACICLNKAHCRPTDPKDLLCGKQCFTLPGIGEVCTEDYGGCPPHFTCSTDGKTIGQCSNPYCPLPTPRPTDPYLLGKPGDDNMRREVESDPSLLKGIMQFFGR